MHLRRTLAAKSSSIFLRPGDVFQIGGVILEIHREASEKPGIELDTIRSLTVASDCAGGKRKRANSGTRDEIESVTCGADTMSLINPKYQQFNKQTIGQNLFKAPEKFLTQRSSDGSTTLVLCENSLPSGRTRVRVFFACSPSIGKTSKAMSLLERKGLLKVNSVEDCDLLCIGQGDLRKKDCDLFCIAKGDVKKICNLVLAVISGKDVVTDDWLEHSIQRSELLYHGSFLAQEPSKELRWDFCLSEAIERGRRALKPLTGYGFYFTPAAAKALGTSFFAVQEIGIQAGAEIVQGSLPRSLCRRDVEKTIHIGAGSDDEDLEELVEGEWRVYSLEFLTTSALRAWIDAESNEFLIRPRGCCELCGAIKKRGNKEYSLRLR